jgi:hypothetical protein
MVQWGGQDDVDHSSSWQPRLIGCTPGGEAAEGFAAGTRGSFHCRGPACSAKQGIADNLALWNLDGDKVPAKNPAPMVLQADLYKKKHARGEA